MTNLIELTLKENILKNNTRFVFPTQMAADLWADRIISIGPVTAVAMERFVAWDTFKGDSIKSKQQDKTAIPSVMRQIFTAQLIQNNANKPFLKSLIVPQYADKASGFTNWISSILTGLSSWKKYFEKTNQAPDFEDEDYLEIYNQYKDFLDSHNLFDPAWETPPFESDGNHYFIFFPEILSDYSEYEEILKSSEDITIVNMPQSPDYVAPSANYYNNSRIELRALALNLLDLHKQKNIPWDEIAVNVPDLDTDGVYIDRELTMHQIPHVMRYAKPLTSFGAGTFFNQLNECVANNFNFDSIKNLLLNTELPWSTQDLNRELISYGQTNNCICSFVQNGKLIDIWQESFSKNYPKNEALVSFYKSLKRDIKKIVEATSFVDIREGYFAFRGAFFDMENCPYETDLVISRCVSELGNLIDVIGDEKYNDCQIPNPYGFFVEVLNSTKYLAQAQNCGVQIIPYKMGATAPFAVHLITDASQKSISVVYKPLSFLRDDKRKKIFGGADDPNVTEEFIKLYQMNSISQEVYFSAAEKTFTGYAQVSSYLEENNATKMENLFEDDENNIYLHEANWFANENHKFPELITDYQFNGYSFWNQNQCESYSLLNDTSKEVLKNRIEKMRKAEGNLIISYSDMNKFYNCPRLWMFDSIAKLSQQDNEAQLMDKFSVGNLYHGILENYFNKIKAKNLCLHSESDNLNDDYAKLLDESVDQGIKDLRESFLAQEQLYTMKAAIYETINNAVVSLSQYFEGYFVAEVESEYRLTDKEKNVQILGRIDLLLQDSGSGEYTLVDFKSTKNSIPDNLYIETEVDNKGNPLAVSEILEEQNLPAFQMPIYLHLMKNADKNAKEVENCCYFGIKDCTLTPVAGNFDSIVKKSKALSMDLYQTEINKTLECVDNYIQRIEKCDFNVNNKVQTFHVCNNCDYRAVCRKVFNVSKKN